MPKNLRLMHLMRAGSAEGLAEVADALREHGGNAWQAAAALGVSHRTMARWLDENARLRALRLEIAHDAGHWRAVHSQHRRRL